jgi:hypothetical protein
MIETIKEENEMKDITNKFWSEMDKLFMLKYQWEYIIRMWSFLKWNIIYNITLTLCKRLAKLTFEFFFME